MKADAVAVSVMTVTARRYWSEVFAGVNPDADSGGKRSRRSARRIRKVVHKQVRHA